MGKGKYTQLLIACAVAFFLGLAAAFLAGNAGRQGSTDGVQAPATADAPAEPAADEVDSADEEPAPETVPDVTTAEGRAAAFPSWEPDSPALASLVSFVEAACDEGSDSYVEPADRIATFDMDGTVLCERAPVYVDYMMLLHRVFDDPTYKAGKRVRRICRQLRANADEGVVDGALDEGKNTSFAQVFAGMTDEEFRAYAVEFFDTVPVEGFEGMTYGESLYQPMVEVIAYLRSRGFDVYMVSACEREVVRALAGSRLDVEPDHVVGTDLGFSATGQGDAAGYEYTMTQDDVLTMNGTDFDECGKANKALAIQREIGKVPVLAFGNSSGDFSMLNYAQSNARYRGMGVLVVADDTEREYGNPEKAASMNDEVAAQGWLGISMRDDWATIYGEGVEKTALVADLALDEAA